MGQNLASLRILLASVIELQELIDYAFLTNSNVDLDALLDLQTERLKRLDNAR